jgi:hypothetical protein
MQRINMASPLGTTCCRKATTNIIHDLEPRQGLQQIAAAGLSDGPKTSKFSMCSVKTI